VGYETWQHFCLVQCNGEGFVIDRAGEQIMQSREPLPISRPTKANAPSYLLVLVTALMYSLIE
jgi:hypothetical protein